MDKVEIRHNAYGDSRTAPRAPTIGEFERANAAHKEHVRKMMFGISEDIKTQARNHDDTKIYEPLKSLFYRELCAKVDGKIDSLEAGEWYQTHINAERHHLNDHCPEDVNLIDVLEMICDCVCAGMARKGNVYPVTISSEILQKAVENTTNMCIEAVEMIE